MRICVVGPSYPFRGGISHYTSLLCRSLGERHDVKLISFRRQYPSLLFPGKTQVDTSDTTIRVDGAEAIIDSMNPFSWHRASRKIADYGPDLVVIQWWHPFFAPTFGAIARRASRHAPVLFICHNVLPHEQGVAPSVRDALLSRRALRWGEMFVAHSEEDARNLRAILPAARISTARHPTYEVFKYREISRGEARESLGIPQNERLVLFFGLVRPYKGLQHLLEAMPDVGREVGARLLVAGEFYEGKDRYISLIKELGISDIITVRDEYVPNESVGTFFAAADVVALPYVSATQSGIVQIAYAFNRPVITTNVGGLPEAVRDGETGLVVPPGDPAALAEAIIRFFRDDLAEPLSNGIRENKAEFSWDRMVETIESLVAQGRRG